jgi:ribosomal protein S18 acetylase RimI-like enzyme
VQAAAGFDELTRPDFLAGIAEFLAIYAAAMDASPDELPSRRAIMERHSGNPGFRALAVSSGEPSHVVAFTYGFHGEPGQWWHDVVRSGITARAGASVALTWLEDVMEIAEVHVHPSYQARGIGRRMVLALAAGRTERTALLSTRDAETPARRLYRSLGFADLLSDFLFPGGGPPYAVMGAVLPLAGGAHQATGAYDGADAAPSTDAGQAMDPQDAASGERPGPSAGAHDGDGTGRAGQRRRRPLRRNR